MPHQARDLKIVELYHGTIPILLCGNPLIFKENYHSKILEDYLKKNNIEFEAFAPNTNHPMCVIPRPEKQGVYKVVGMGYCDVDTFVRYFKPPYGSCRDYNMKTDPEFDKIVIERMNQAWVRP